MGLRLSAGGAGKGHARTIRLRRGEACGVLGPQHLRVSEGELNRITGH